MALSRILSVAMSSAPRQALAARLRSQLNLEYVKRDLDYIDEFCDSRDALVLDLGCQTGYVTAYLASKHYTAVGVDVECPRWQSRIWKRLSADWAASFLQGTGESLPLRGNNFGVIVAYATIEHIRNIQAVLQEVHRILSDNGLFFVFGLPRRRSLTERIGRLIGLWHHQRLFEESEFLGILARNGFAVEDIRSVNFFPASLTIWNVAYLWLFLSYAERLIERTPLRLLSHSLVIVSSKRTKTKS